MQFQDKANMLFTRWTRQAIYLRQELDVSKEENPEAVISRVGDKQIREKAASAGFCQRMGQAMRNTQ